MLCWPLLVLVPLLVLAPRIHQTSDCRTSLEEAYACPKCATYGKRAEGSAPPLLNDSPRLFCPLVSIT